MSIIKSILGTVAPILASALPGPLGPIAKKAITGLLGLDEGSTQDEIEKTLASASPETLEKLKQLDADFKVQMRKLDIDLEKVYADDRSSARQREVSLRDWTPRVLAFIVVSGWVVVTGFVLKNVIPDGNKDVVMRSLGTLDMALGSVLFYYFGSSSGSRSKDDVIAKAANGK